MCVKLAEAYGMKEKYFYLAMEKPAEMVKKK